MRVSNAFIQRSCDYDRWLSTLFLPSARRPCAGGADNGNHRGAGFSRTQTPRAPPPLGEVLPVGLHRRVSHRDHPLGPALASRRLPLCAGNDRLWLGARRLRSTTLSAETLPRTPAGEAVDCCPYRRGDWLVRGPVDGLLCR